MKILRWLGVVVGVSVLIAMLRRVGWDTVASVFPIIGPRIVFVLAYPLSWILLNTAGWHAAIHRAYANVPFQRLVAVRLAGETFNSLLPSGYVGGEPLKAKLLAQWMPMRESATSVLVAKAAQSIALIFYVGMGLSIGGGSQSPWHQRTTLVAAGLLALGIGAFTVLLTQRAFSRLANALHRLTGHPWLQAQEEKLRALDDALGVFYREEKPAFVKSVLWHFAGWIAGAMEVAVIFYLIGAPIGWRQAWFIGAMAQLAAIIGLLVPAGVGLFEGGHYMAASLLGLPPALGLSVSLIRRVREVFWDGIGLGLFWRLTKRKPGAA